MKEKQINDWRIPQNDAEHINTQPAQETVLTPGQEVQLRRYGPAGREISLVPGQKDVAISQIQDMYMSRE